MVERPIRTALIGCGGSGRRWTRAAPSGLAIRVFADIDVDRAGAFAAEFGGQAAQVDAVVGDPNIEAVIIATPHNTHPRLVADAVAAGKHVVVDPPLTTTAPSARRLADDIRAAGVQVFLGLYLRYAPCVAMARRLLPQPSFAHGHALHDPPPEGSWRRDLVAGGGPMWYWGIHMLDLVCELMGVAPDRVFANGGGVTRGDASLPDTAMVTMQFGGGRFAALAVSEPGAPPHVGPLFLEMTDGTRAIQLWEGLMRGSARGFAADGDLPQKNLLPDLDQSDERPFTGAALAPEDPDGSRALLSAFATAIRTGIAPAGAPDVEAGVRATALARAVLGSLHQGQPRRVT